MSEFTGLLVAGSELIGEQALITRPRRGLVNPTYRGSDGAYFTLPDIVADVVIEERLSDKLEVTDHPVEVGAMVSDHAFKLPSEVVLHLGWSNSPPQSDSGGLLGAAFGAAAAISPATLTIINGLELGASISNLLTGANADEMAAIYESLLNLQTTRSLFDVYTGKRVLPNMVCLALAVENDWKKENALFVQMTCKQVIIVNSQSVTLPASTQKDPLATASPVNNGTRTLTPVTLQPNGVFTR